MDAQTGLRELAGQVAIVTGAGVNTGSTIAKTLASAGAAVVVNYRNSKGPALETVGEIEASGGRAIAVQAECVCKLTSTGSSHRLLQHSGCRISLSTMPISVAIARSWTLPWRSGGKRWVPHWTEPSSASKPAFRICGSWAEARSSISVVPLATSAYQKELTSPRLKRDLQG